MNSTAHPFVYPTPAILNTYDREKRLRSNGIGFAHNGGIAGFDQIRVPLIMKCNPNIVKYIEGNTDSEVMFGTLLELFRKPAC